MGFNGMSGPDMAKMLQMMMPYMDPSTKRMMSIMMKLQELKTLMQPPQSENREATVPKAENREEAQPPKEEMRPVEEKNAGTVWDPAVILRGMDDMDKGVQSNDLAAALQEGLTPEQQSMITSLSGMLR